MMRLHSTLMIVVFFSFLQASFLTDSLNIQLVSGDGDCSGRVEIFHDGQWGTVCDDNWDMKDADVVCRQMGCGKAVEAHVGAYFGKGSGSILLNNVNCSGREGFITDCSHDGFKKHNCGHGEDAGVVCSARNIRLLNGTGYCCGRVEIYHNGQWGTVCDDDWNMKDAEVVCRQMGCGTAVSFPRNASFGWRSVPVLLNNIHCSGTENSITQCSYNDPSACKHGKDVGVICSEFLQSPTLTLISPNSAVSPGEAVQFRCMSAEPTCISVEFSLYKNGEPVKTQKAETSTIFTVTVGTSDQGQYSCDYSYRRSSSNISSSMSNSISITVVLLIPIIISAAAAAGLLLLSVPIITFFIKRHKKQKQQVTVVMDKKHGVKSSEDNEKTEMEDDFENRKIAIGSKNTNRITCLRNKMEDEDDDYENVTTVVHERAGSVDYDEDYIVVDAELEKAAAANYCEGEHIYANCKE